MLLIPMGLTPDSLKVSLTLFDTHGRGMSVGLEEGAQLLQLPN